MPVNLSIKNAPDDVVERLRRRAERHHRSLQGELLAIIEDAARPQLESSPAAPAATDQQVPCPGRASLVDDLLAGPAWDDELAEAVMTRARGPSRDAIF
jgi:plasmid stability protein